MDAIFDLDGVSAYFSHSKPEELFSDFDNEQCILTKSVFCKYTGAVGF